MLRTKISVAAHHLEGVSVCRAKGAGEDEQNEVRFWRALQTIVRSQNEDGSWMQDT